MYLPKVFEENRADVLRDLIASHPLGTVVTLNDQGLQANHIPFLFDSSPEPLGTLYAHVARANPLWRELSRTAETLVIFQGPQTYISPSWYPTKSETGMVVPTWNYAVVHAYGRLEAIDDKAWLGEFVTKLTDIHESGNPEPWAVSDAPAEYIDHLLSSIVGLKLTITRLAGKLKLSQNRPAQDRVNVIRTLKEQDSESARAMAEAIQKANGAE